MHLLRNKEYKYSIVVLALIFIFFSFLMYYVSNNNINRIKEQVYMQNISAFGKLASAFPGHEHDIAEALLEKPEESEINKGRSILSSYGYNENTPLYQTPVLKTTIYPFNTSGILVFAAFFIAVIIVVSACFRKVFRRVEKISIWAERAIDGNFELNYQNEDEGSFAILEHHVNQLTNRLKKSLESLMEEKNFLKDIIADISHQLKTPLSTLVINNDILAGDLNMNEEMRMKFLESSNQQLARLEWLIMSLLKMARLESGSVVFKKEHIPIIEPLKQAYDYLSAMANDYDIKLLVVNDEPDIFINGDRDWLCESFINIVKNCIEHCPPGCVVKASSYKTAMTVGLVIWDNGEGIEKKDLPHIFKRFYKGSSKKPTSVGIGLSLSKVIVEGHDGSIIARSEKGKGTEFIVTFMKALE